MWVFMNDAFLSIVAHRDDEGSFMVRARAEGDIERVFPRAKVEETPHADYRYRATLPRSEVGGAVYRNLMEIDYPNFKGSIAKSDYPRHDAYMEVWQAMYSYQHTNVKPQRRTG